MGARPTEQVTRPRCICALICLASLLGCDEPTAAIQATSPIDLAFYTVDQAETGNQTMLWRAFAEAYAGAGRAHAARDARDAARQVGALPSDLALRRVYFVGHGGSSVADGGYWWFRGTSSEGGGVFEGRSSGDRFAPTARDAATARASRALVEAIGRRSIRHNGSRVLLAWISCFTGGGSEFVDAVARDFHRANGDAEITVGAYQHMLDFDAGIESQSFALSDGTVARPVIAVYPRRVGIVGNTRSTRVPPEPPPFERTVTVGPR